MADERSLASVCEVLYGHRVSDSVDIDELGPDRGMTIRPAELDRLLESRREWLAIDGEDLLRWRVAERGRAPCYLLTFDDGYRDNLTEALPILENSGVPALIFVTTGFVGAERLPASAALALIIKSTSELHTPEGQVLPCAEMAAKWRIYDKMRPKLKRKGVWRRDRYINDLAVINGVSLPEADGNFLSWDEVRLLDQHPLVTIGAHTRSHPSLCWSTPGYALQEIRGAKIELECHLGHVVDHFAYPHGAHNVFVEWLVRRAGFRLGFTTVPRQFDLARPPNRYRIPRFDLKAVVAEYAAT